MNSAAAIVVLRFIPLALLVSFSISLLHFMKADEYIVKDQAVSGDKDFKSGLEKGKTYSLVAKKENLSKQDEIAGVRWFISEKITLGRDDDNDVIINSPYASGYHAQIEQQGEELWIEDLKSTNGTYVNGKKISGKMLLQPSDLISIGGKSLEVEGGGKFANGSSDPRGAGKAEE